MPRTAIPAADGSGAMFDRIARRYDRLNRVLSLGLDRGWRRRLVEALAPAASGPFLDVATGTGDVALALARRYPTARVTGLDPSPEMLALARRKIAARGLADRIELLQGVAERLPFGDGTFAATTIAFGIRNASDRPAALRELGRVTARGGLVAVLELGEPEAGLLAPLVRWHLRHVVPRLGGWLGGATEYGYLQRSVAAFPAPDRFAVELHEAGLSAVCSEPLGFGAANLYVACV